MHFYSHAPRGARRRPHNGEDYVDRFLLTRPSRGATTPETDISAVIVISTHTPLAGRDARRQDLQQFLPHFYSHAPRGARPGNFPNRGNLARFLLTRPSRGATVSDHAGPQRYLYFYSHAPRGARHTVCRKPTIRQISTHTPLAGRD